MCVKIYVDIVEFTDSSSVTPTIFFARNSDSLASNSPFYTDFTFLGDPPKSPPTFSGLFELDEAHREADEADAAQEAVADIPRQEVLDWIELYVSRL